jgi:hypothetical protein
MIYILDKLYLRLRVLELVNRRKITVDVVIHRIENSPRLLQTSNDLLSRVATLSLSWLSTIAVGNSLSCLMYSLTDLRDVMH